jgi:hypothetical protein
LKEEEEVMVNDMQILGMSMKSMSSLIRRATTALAAEEGGDEGGGEEGKDERGEVEMGGHTHIYRGAEEDGEGSDEEGKSASPLKPEESVFRPLGGFETFFGGYFCVCV